MTKSLNSFPVGKLLDFFAKTMVSPHSKDFVKQDGGKWLEVIDIFRGGEKETKKRGRRAHDNRFKAPGMTVIFGKNASSRDSNGGFVLGI